MKNTIRTVWSTLLVIHISVNLFRSTLLVLIRVRTVCQGYQETTKVTASDSLSGQRLCYSHQCQTVNRQNVDPDRGSNCLPRLSADDKSRSEQGIIYIG